MTIISMILCSPTLLHKLPLYSITTLFSHTSLPHIGTTPLHCHCTLVQTMLPFTKAKQYHHTLTLHSDIPLPLHTNATNCYRTPMPHTATVHQSHTLPLHTMVTYYHHTKGSHTATAPPSTHYPHISPPSTALHYATSLHTAKVHQPQSWCHKRGYR